MMDIENVIGRCKQAIDSGEPVMAYEFYYSVINLLKEQEPKLVKIDRNRGVLCPSCGNELFTYPRQKFCDECGQAVKWE